MIFGQHCEANTKSFFSEERKLVLDLLLCRRGGQFHEPLTHPAAHRFELAIYRIASHG